MGSWKPAFSNLGLGHFEFGVRTLSDAFLATGERISFTIRNRACNFQKRSAAKLSVSGSSGLENQESVVVIAETGPRNHLQIALKMTMFL